MPSSLLRIPYNIQNKSFKSQSGTIFALWNLYINFAKLQRSTASSSFLKGNKKIQMNNIYAKISVLFLPFTKVRKILQVNIGNLLMFTCKVFAKRLDF